VGEAWFFDGWAGVARVIVLGAAGYAGIVLVLRLTGKRTLSKMNAFDLVVTVALGSTFATLVVSGQTALVEGLAAFAALSLLQYGVAWGAARWPAFRDIVKARPALLLEEGRMLDAALEAERVSPEEVLAAIRQSGQRRIEDVRAVLLETDGTFSVIAGGGDGDATALGNVRRLA